MTGIGIPTSQSKTAGIELSSGWKLLLHHAAWLIVTRAAISELIEGALVPNLIKLTLPARREGEAPRCHIDLWHWICHTTRSRNTRSSQRVDIPSY
jgi:hypothetical protein